MDYNKTKTTDKIIRDAEMVVSELEQKLFKQAGGKITNLEVKIPESKQKKIDALISLIHYSVYLSEKNTKLYSAISDQQITINLLTHKINKLQSDSIVDKKMKEF